MSEATSAGELGELHRDPVSLLMRYYREHGTHPTFLNGRTDYVVAFGAE